MPSCAHARVQDFGLALERERTMMQQEEDDGAMASAEDDSGPSLVLALRSSTKRRGTNAAKRNLAHRGRLPLVLNAHAAAAAAAASLEDDEARLASCLSALDQLPRQSSWARHRRRVLTKAITLLRISR